MVDAVITANWSEVKRQYSNIWQQVEKLKKNHPIEIEPILKHLDEAVASQTGQDGHHKRRAALLTSCPNR
jgi:hypothetical protein